MHTYRIVEVQTKRRNGGVITEERCISRGNPLASARRALALLAGYMEVGTAYRIEPDVPCRITGCYREQRRRGGNDA